MINYFKVKLEVETLEIQISEEISSQIPHFKVGIIEYKQIKVQKSPQMLKGRLQFFQESLFFDLEDQNVTDLKGIKEWRDIFKQLGKDPNRYRHSAEALFRRVKKQNYLQPMNSGIDLNNFFSLQYEIPIGIYDFNKLSGEIKIRLGNEEESYEGLNRRMNSLHNLIVSVDEIGPFGSPFVDSNRAPIDEQTTSALQIIYLQPSLQIDQCKKQVEAIMNMFTQIHAGEGNFTIKGL